MQPLQQAIQALRQTSPRTRMMIAVGLLLVVGSTLWIMLRVAQGYHQVASAAQAAVIPNPQHAENSAYAQLAPETLPTPIQHEPPPPQSAALRAPPAPQAAISTPVSINEAALPRTALAQLPPKRTRVTNPFVKTAPAPTTSGRDLFARGLDTPSRVLSASALPTPSNVRPLLPLLPAPANPSTLPALPVPSANALNLGASPSAPAPAATPPQVPLNALERFALEHQIRLAATAIGQNPVATFETKHGEIIVAQGQTFPGESVALSRVSSRQVVLTLGKHSKTFDLP